MTTTIDREALRRQIYDEIVGLLAKGWPEPVIEGFMIAKAAALADQVSDARWQEFGDFLDAQGAQVHGGDPIRKARIEHFNEMLIAELKKKQGL